MLNGSQDIMEQLDDGPSSNPSGQSVSLADKQPSSLAVKPPVWRIVANQPDSPVSQSASLAIERHSTPLESLLGFLTVEEVGTAFNQSNWTVAEEVAILAAIAQGKLDGVTPRDRMAAITRLRQVATTVLKLGGHVSEVSRVGVQSASLPDGQTAKLIQTERTMKLLTEAASQTSYALACNPSGGLIQNGRQAANQTNSQAAWQPDWQPGSQTGEPSEAPDIFDAEYDAEFEPVSQSAKQPDCLPDCQTDDQP